MLKTLTKPETLIAAAMMAFAAYLMWHATALPIGWDGTRGPGGGAFPFWLSAIMFVAAAGIFLRSIIEGIRPEDLKPFFEPGMLGPVLAVTLALGLTILLMPIIGAYLAIPLFMLWYLRFYGRNGWTVTMSLTLVTPVALFFFFEVALLILLPKGVTEPLFFPLYAMFF